MTNKDKEKKTKSKDVVKTPLVFFRKTDISTLEAADDSILQTWLQNQFHSPSKKKK